MNFTDHSIFPVPSAKPLLGSVEGGKVIEIMNVMVLNFFDKYLKEEHNIDLIGKAELFSEIEIATNIN